MSHKKYYFDESGNTGDTIFKGAPNNFDQQPYFSLSAIHFSDEDILENKVNELKTKHKIQLPELKSSKLYKKRDEFTLELIDFLLERESEIIIEVVDKKYLLSVNMERHLVLPPFDTGPHLGLELYIRNKTADLLVENISNKFFEQYSFISQNSSHENMNYLFERFLYELSLKKHVSEISTIIPQVEMTYDDYKKEIKSTSKSDISPVPDKNKRGEDLFFLPNIQSFTNIYARINLLNNCNVSNVKLVHDEQDHFDELIKMYKKTLEDWKHVKQFAPNSDYNFTSKGDLAFENSKNNIGIQVADMLAGFSMRYIKDIVEEKNISKTKKEIFCKLQNLANITKGLGINIVTSEKVMNSLYKTCNKSFSYDLVYLNIKS